MFALKRYLVLELLTKRYASHIENYKEKEAVWDVKRAAEEIDSKRYYGVSCNKFRNKEHAFYSFLYQKF